LAVHDDWEILDTEPEEDDLSSESYTYSGFVKDGTFTLYREEGSVREWIESDLFCNLELMR